MGVKFKNKKKIPKAQAGGIDFTSVLSGAGSGMDFGSALSGLQGSSMFDANTLGNLSGKQNINLEGMPTSGLETTLGGTPVGAAGKVNGAPSKMNTFGNNLKKPYQDFAKQNMPDIQKQIASGDFSQSIGKVSDFGAEYIRGQQAKGKYNTINPIEKTKVGEAIKQSGLPMGYSAGEMVNTGKELFTNNNGTKIANQDLGISTNQSDAKGAGFAFGGHAVGTATGGVILGLTGNKEAANMTATAISGLTNMGRSAIYGAKDARLNTKRNTNISRAESDIYRNKANQQGMDMYRSFNPANPDTNFAKKGGTLRAKKCKSGSSKIKFANGGMMPKFTKGAVILGGQRHHESHPKLGKGNPGIDPSTGEKQFETEKGELLLNIQQTEMLNQVVEQGNPMEIGQVMAQILSQTIDNSGEYAKA